MIKNLPEALDCLRINIECERRLENKNRLIIEIIAGLGILSSSLFKEAPQAVVPSNIEIVVEAPIEPKPKTTEERVREYFNDSPIMVEVAYCESRYRQVGKDGKIMRGEVNPNDVGVMQINTMYHGKTAEKMGIDIYTLEGNLEYAKHLYKKQGVQPWRSSSPCWEKRSAHLALK